MEKAELKEQRQQTKLLSIITRLIGFTFITGVAGSLLIVFSESITDDNGFILGMFILDRIVRYCQFRSPFNLENIASRRNFQISTATSLTMYDKSIYACANMHGYYYFKERKLLILICIYIYIIARTHTFFSASKHALIFIIDTSV